MQLWSMMRLPVFTLSLQLMMSAPAHATVYMVQISGKVTGLEGAVSTFGDVSLGDLVDFTLKLDDATPEAEVLPTTIFGMVGNPPPVTGTLKIGSEFYQNSGNSLSYYSNYGRDVSSIVQSYNAAGPYQGVIDAFSIDVLNTSGIKSDNFTETGSWYVGPANFGSFERQTGVGTLGVGPDYTIANIDFIFHFLTVYKEGDPVPTLPVGAVPEPSAWSMMIGGMAIVGGLMRRRLRRNADPAQPPGFSNPSFAST